MKPEDLLRTLFDVAVRRALAEQVVPGNLPEPPKGRTVVVGAGKASAAMASVLETAWPAGAPISGLVITRYGHLPNATPARPSAIEVVEARHPVPDDAGAQATARILALLKGLTEDDLVIALISGGASALLVSPADGISLSEKQLLTEALLASGAPISQIGVVRKHLSRVKGGQLAAAAWPAPVLTLAISDVPGDDLAIIGSGPTVGDDTTSADALAILDRWKINIPDNVRRHLNVPTSVLEPLDPRLAKLENEIVAAPFESLAAAADRAVELGCKVRSLGDNVEGEAWNIAKQHAALALEIQSSLAVGTTPVVLLSGGELTVTRSGDEIGGPNAEYCLALALALNGASNIFAIAGDTDGVDGAAEVAGALISPATLPAAAALGIDPYLSLRQNDAHTFFAALGQQVVTGPTLTNVNDFRAVWIGAAEDKWRQLP